MSDSYIAWLRKRVGRRKVFLAFATVIVRDEYGRFLLQRRTDFDFWGLPGGVLELDEDLQTCARRELLEETGLVVGDLDLVGLYTDPRYDVTYPNGDQVQQFTVCFAGQISGGEMRPDGVETSAQAFFTKEETDNLTLPIWYRDMIADVLRGGLPAFRPPFASEQTADQIAAVRPYIGQALYSGVGAVAVVVAEDGRILMLQHVDETGWRPPSGFSDLGENVAQTAVREVWEETRLHIEPERIIAVNSTPKLNSKYKNGDRVKNLGITFRARLLGGEPRLDANEIRSMAWMTPREALSKIDESRRWFYKEVFSHLDYGCFVC